MSKRVERAHVVSPDGDTTHVLVPADEYHRLTMGADGPSRAAIDAAARILNDPTTTWHDANAVLGSIVRSGLESARRERGLTQAELGAMLGMPQSQVSRLERNLEGTTLRVLRRIAEALSRGADPSQPRSPTTPHRPG